MESREHCEHHEESVKTTANHGARIIQLEKQDDKLFEILTVHTKALGDIKACMKKISFQFDAFEKTYADILRTTNGNITTNSSKITALEITVDEIAEFAWFRKKVTWFRDNVFWTLAGLIGVAVAGLMVLHTASNKFVDFILKWIGRAGV
jgi:hypothetical protein